MQILILLISLHKHGIKAHRDVEPPPWLSGQIQLLFSNPVTSLAWVRSLGDASKIVWRAEEKNLVVLPPT